MHLLASNLMVLNVIEMTLMCLVEGERAERQLQRVRHSTPESDAAWGNPRSDADPLRGISRPRNSQMRAVAARHDRTAAGTPARKLPRAYSRPLQASI